MSTGSVDLDRIIARTQDERDIDILKASRFSIKRLRECQAICEQQKTMVLVHGGPEEVIERKLLALDLMWWDYTFAIMRRCDETQTV